jgi:putative membrane protein
MEQFFAAGYYHAKALHVIGFVSWFAGLFYIARLYIYDVEADLREPAERRVLQEQLRMMQRRLWYGITWPAMILTFVFGWWMLAPRLLGSMPWETWLLIKLGLVTGLFGYHLMCGRIRKQLVAGTCRWSSQGLRVWNEVATLFLVAIVFDAVLKTLGNVLWGVAGLVLFAIALMIAIRVYRRIREASEARADQASRGV